MRIALIILIGIHGIIHLFGFLKAFQWSEFDAISQPISKASGIFWLLTTVLFAVTVILILLHCNYWLLSGFLAVLISQVLIVAFWSDAKFGTVANIIILLAILLGYSSVNFKQKIIAERRSLFEHSQSASKTASKAYPQTGLHDLITKEDLAGLPPGIQTWLMNSGLIGTPWIANVYLAQDLELKMKPEQTDWIQGTADQYFSVHPPAFHWRINTRMNSVLHVAGRDKFEDGQGEMLIKLLSLIPVADAKNDVKVNQATLQRYLAEIVWFPSAALSPYIAWEHIDDRTAKATMEYNGTKGSGEFHFDENGNFKKFVAMRFKDANDAEPALWTVRATRIEDRNGVRIPTECEASWDLEKGQWTWLKLKITDIQYNVQEMPAPSTGDTQGPLACEN